MPERILPLQDVIQEIEKQIPAHADALTRRTKEKKARRNELLVPMPRMKMIREKTLRVPLERPYMTSPEKCIAIFRAALESIPHEEYFVMTLDGNLQFINLWRCGMGGIDHVEVDRAELFTAVLAKDSASYFMLAHNHPKTGDPTPSEEDFEVLEDIKKGGLYLGRPMRDFVIIGKNGTYYSHREKNYEL